MEDHRTGDLFILGVMEYYVIMITECNSDHSNHDEFNSLEDDYV